MDHKIFIPIQVFKIYWILLQSLVQVLLLKINHCIGYVLYYTTYITEAVYFLFYCTVYISWIFFYWLIAFEKKFVRFCLGRKERKKERRKNEHFFGWHFVGGFSFLRLFCFILSHFIFTLFMCLLLLVPKHLNVCVYIYIYINWKQISAASNLLQGPR